MKKSVILIVLNNFKNDSRVIKEAISLKKAGYNVTVVALWEEGLEEKEIIQNVHVHRIKLRTKNWSKNKIIQLIKYFEFIIKVIKKYKHIDIFHCNDLNTLPIGVIIKKFFNKKAKLVYDAHEFEINDKPNESKLMIKFKYFLEKVLIKYPNKVITVSDGIANEYVKLYNIKKPIIVFNTPPYKRIKKKDLFRKKFDIEKNKKIFLYQGGLTKGRGIELLIEAFKQVNDNNVIVFMGDGELKNIIKKVSEKYKNIYFHPPVSVDILLDYTSSADWGLLLYENNCLNHYYCLPNKIFEYVMGEIPVIVSNLYEIRKLVERYKIGIVVKEYNIEELRKAIKEVLNLDKKELQNNIQKIKKIYNWEKQEKILLNIYKDL